MSLQAVCMTPKSSLRGKTASFDEAISVIILYYFMRCHVATLLAMTL
ncbi:RND transporter [Rickettsia hoogstraalii]|nr:RND transporter [Rickettsia hoogstraalii]